MAKLPTLKPLLPELQSPYPSLSDADYRKIRRAAGKSLKQRQLETGRTLALDGAAWRRLRAAVLAGEPLCRMCWSMGRTTPATHVDHIDNDPANNADGNLQPLCHECHSRKTNADMGRRVAMGCDTNGMPLDPSHPWSQKSPATAQGKPDGSPCFTAHCLKNRQS